MLSDNWMKRFRLEVKRLNMFFESCLHIDILGFWGNILHSLSVLSLARERLTKQFSMMASTMIGGGRPKKEVW